LLLTLLRHWSAGPAPARLAGVLERTEHSLAAAIRAELSKAGLAFPDLSDGALVAWFAATHPRAGAATPPAIAKTIARFAAANPWLPALAWICCATSSGAR
jgi:hypothetical protein